MVSGGMFARRSDGKDILAVMMKSRVIGLRDFDHGISVDYFMEI